jgi:hypothetical protein
VAVKPGPRTTLRGGLQRAAVEDDGAGIAFALQSHAQDGPQIMSHRLEASGLDPAPGLLIDNLPGRQIMRHHPPLSSHFNQVAKGVEGFPQWIHSLRCLLTHQSEITHAELPFLIAHIRRIIFSQLAHPQLIAGVNVKSTAFYFKELITGSRENVESRFQPNVPGSNLFSSFVNFVPFC